MNRVLFVRWLTFACLSFVAVLGACQKPFTASEQQYAAKLENTERLIEKQPAPDINYSMDRFLLAERLVRFNDPTKMTYLYITLMDGTWLKVTIVGKLTSTSKRLNRQEQTFRFTSPDCTSSNKQDCISTMNGQAQDEMGVYGSSEPAKVGMTTAGSLLEFGGFASYLYSETPLAFSGLDKKMVEVTVEVTDTERKELQKNLDTLTQKMNR